MWKKLWMYDVDWPAVSSKSKSESFPVYVNKNKEIEVIKKCMSTRNIYIHEYITIVCCFFYNNQKTKEKTL